jgi:hypothetical protein
MNDDENVIDVVVTTGSVTISVESLPFALADAANKLLEKGGPNLVSKVCENVSAGFGIASLSLIMLDAANRYNKHGGLTDEDRYQVGLSLIKTGGLYLIGGALLGPVAVGILTVINIAVEFDDSIGSDKIDNFIIEKIQETRNMLDDAELARVTATSKITSDAIQHHKSMVSTLLAMGDITYLSIYEMAYGHDNLYNAIGYSLRTALEYIIETAILTDDYHERNQYLFAIKDFIMASGHDPEVYRDILNQIESLLYLPPDMGFIDRIFFVMQNSNFNGSAILPNLANMYSMQIEIVNDPSSNWVSHKPPLQAVV